MLQLRGPLRRLGWLAGWNGSTLPPNGPRAPQVTETATHAFPHLDDWAARPLSPHASSSGTASLSAVGPWLQSAPPLIHNQPFRPA